jgi:hypothetical protein
LDLTPVCWTHEDPQKPEISDIFKMLTDLEIANRIPTFKVHNIPHFVEYFKENCDKIDLLKIDEDETMYTFLTNILEVPKINPNIRIKIDYLTVSSSISIELGNRSKSKACSKFNSTKSYSYKSKASHA